mgnify:CR=1 FL=1
MFKAWAARREEKWSREYREYLDLPENHPRKVKERARIAKLQAARWRRGPSRAATWSDRFDRWLSRHPAVEEALRVALMAVGYVLAVLFVFYVLPELASQPYRLPYPFE